MKLYKKDQFLYYKNVGGKVNDEFLIENGHASFETVPGVGSGDPDKVYVIVYRREGYATNRVVDAKVLISDIVDQFDAPYGSTLEELFLGFNKGVNVKIQDQDEEYIDVQNPFPTDGDSVYSKDLDLGNSDIGDFDGEIQTLFNDYRSNNVAAPVGSGGSNPKTFTIAFKRPLVSSTIGLTSPDNSLSNGKLTLTGLSGEIKVVDLSSDNTKRGRLIFQFEQQFFLGVDIEFHTDDEVTIGGMGILKSQSTTIDAITGIITTDNSTNVPLPADTGGVDHIFTGSAVDTKNYGMIVVSLKSDAASATDGLSVQFSPDGTNWDHTDEFTIAANTGKTFSFQTAARWLRVVYTNGTVVQTYFRMQTVLKPVYVKPSSHRIADTISGQDDAELVKSNLTAKSQLTALFENISSYREVLNVNNAWVHRKIVNETYHQDTINVTNPSTGISAGDTVITVDDATGFITGDEIKLEEVVDGVGQQEIGIITLTDVTGSVFTLDRPVGFDYTTAAIITEVITNMAVDGTLANPQIFEIDAPDATIWQFTRIMFSMVHATAADDGKFGGIAALTNGVCLRATTAAGRTVVFANWKTNADMKLDMFDVIYSDKAPAGNNATNGRWTFTKAEVIAELDGDASPIQKLELLVQDPLSGLISFYQRGQGRVFSP